MPIDRTKNIPKAIPTREIDQENLLGSKKMQRNADSIAVSMLTKTTSFHGYGSFGRGVIRPGWKPPLNAAHTERSQSIRIAIHHRKVNTGFIAINVLKIVKNYRCKSSLLRAQRFALAACCHANQLTKRNHVFEQEKALKRNVATRQPARDVGRFCKAVLNLNLVILHISPSAFLFFKTECLKKCQHPYENF